jgi:hypothetical protein
LAEQARAIETVVLRQRRRQPADPPSAMSSIGALLCVLPLN